MGALMHLVCFIFYYTHVSSVYRVHRVGTPHISVETVSQCVVLTSTPIVFMGFLCGILTNTGCKWRRNLFPLHRSLNRHVGS